MLIFNPSHVCYNIDMDIFSPAQPASFVKFHWHYWREFSLSWKDLTKTLQSHGKLQSLTDLIHGANIDTHSNSRDWLFWMFIMSKINPLTNKCVLFWKDVQTVFSIFIKNSRNAIPKYEHIIAPSVSSTSTFTRNVGCCADFIDSNVEHQKWSR